MHTEDNNKSIQHLAIIMDGNGRWAKKRGLPRTMGHRAGAKTFRTVCDYALDRGIAHLTAYVFSTENWKRPQDEVDAIMSLLREYLEELYSNQDEYLRKGVRVKFLGKVSDLDLDIRDRMRHIERETANLSRMTLNLAINYGGREDILQAVRRVAKEVQMGSLTAEELSEKMFSEFLYTQGQPDPDLILRTGGEYRLSNFLLWQAAYSEYIATETLWPDMAAKELDAILEAFHKRERRFGATSAETGVSI